MRDDDLFIAEASEAAGSTYPGYRKDLCDAFLRQIDTPSFSCGRVAGEKVKQITELDKGTVVILMRALIKEQIDIGRIPVHCAEHELRILCQHFEKIIIGKAERFHIGDRCGGNRLLYFENRTMTAGKDCPLAVKRGNLTGTVLVFQRGPGNAGHDVKDMCYGFSVIPQIFIFSKCPYCVGL